VRSNLACGVSGDGAQHHLRNPHDHVRIDDVLEGQGLQALSLARESGQVQRGMNRPLKFRVWDIRHEKMGTLDSWNGVGEEGKYCYVTCYVSGGNSHHALIQNEDAEIMQFTGLLDKNGKEIYEGDIVECWFPSTKVVPQKFNASVTFYEGMYIIATLNGEPASLRDAIVSSNNEKKGLEIIGNIYENEDLLV
jgi:uncharacterized phage protein (TIGR01671 family)